MRGLLCTLKKLLRQDIVQRTMDDMRCAQVTRLRDHTTSGHVPIDCPQVPVWERAHCLLRALNGPVPLNGPAVPLKTGKSAASVLMEVDEIDFVARMANARDTGLPDRALMRVLPKKLVDLYMTIRTLCETIRAECDRPAPRQEANRKRQCDGLSARVADVEALLESFLSLPQFANLPEAF